MGGIFIAAPQVVALPEAFEKWTANRHTWLFEGQTWDLSDGASGVWLHAGARGMAMPPIQRYPRKSPAVAGSMYGGSIADEREVFWPLEVCSGDDSQAWLDHDARWWSTMRPDRTGVWRITQPSGVYRDLTVRFASDGDPSFDVAPELFGWHLYGITLVAEQPYWRGEPIHREWSQSETPENFYGGGSVSIRGYGPPYHITPGATMGTARITNPGDVPAEPVWRIYGPSTSVTVGVGALTVTVPFTLAAGEWVYLDTAPTDRRALFGTDVDPDGRPDLVGAENRTQDLAASTAFGRIDPGQEMPVAVTMIGSGRVECEINPHYYRAW